MRGLITLLLTVILVNLFQGCKSSQLLQQSNTALTQNFNQPYTATWKAVNEVIDREPYKVIKKNEDIGLILLKPLETGLFNPWDYVKSVPTDMINIQLDSLKIIIRGSDEISAVQITPKFFVFRRMSGVSTQNPSQTKGIRSIREPIESNGSLEIELFEKIHASLK